MGHPPRRFFLTRTGWATRPTAVKAMKQSVARRLVRPGEHFWQARYYDFNLGTPEKRVEELKYMHRNPVKRGLVERPEDWPWSSFRHYATGEVGTVEIESPWTAWKRRQSEMGSTASPMMDWKRPAQAALERGTPRGV